MCFFLCTGSLQNVCIHVSLQVPAIYSLSNVSPLLLRAVTVLPSIYTICLCRLLDISLALSSCQWLSRVGFSKSAFLIMGLRNVKSYFLILSIFGFILLVTHMFPLWYLGYSQYPSMGNSPSFLFICEEMAKKSLGIDMLYGP